jgi:hypothetical protein
VYIDIDSLQRKRCVNLANERNSDNTHTRGIDAGIPHT